MATQPDDCSVAKPIKPQPVLQHSFWPDMSELLSSNLGKWQASASPITGQLCAVDLVQLQDTCVHTHTHTHTHTHMHKNTHTLTHCCIPSGLLSEFTSDSVRLTQADSTLDSLCSGCSSDGWQPFNNGHIVHLPVILPYLVVAGFSFTVASHWEAVCLKKRGREIERKQCTFVRVNEWAY